MKKIISMLAMFYLSFSCFAEDYFVKVANDEYILQHGEKSRDLGLNSENDEAVEPVDAIYTPTHIFTYLDGNPAQFRNILKIDYSESEVIFVKDIKSRKCCIDILDNEESNNKCRILGVTGRNIGNFEVYEAAEDANCFSDSKSRLIFVDHSGLYIVSKEENSIESISQNYFRNGSFDFKGKVIKVSAIDGKREVSGCIFNCPYDAPLPFGSTEFAPIMEQIKQITGVMPKDVPPSEEAALRRLAEILNVPIELLVIEDGKAYLVDATRAALAFGNNPTRYPASTYGQVWNSYVLELKKFISVKQDLKQSIFQKAYSKIGTKNYEFDTSNEAKDRRRKLAQQPWPDIREFTHVLEQIEKITGVRPSTLPPNKNVALKRVADIFEIPVEILTFKEGKVHLIDMKSIQIDPSGINAQLKALCDRDSSNYYKSIITYNIGSLTNRYRDQLQRYLPIYSTDYLSSEQIKAASIRITSNVCNKWDPQTKKFSPDAGVYLFDASPGAQQRRREIAQQPWEE